MAVWKLFSQRVKEAAGTSSADVYQYDKVPNSLRVQVTQIAIETLGRVGSSGAFYGDDETENTRWLQIEKLFCREKGVYRLGNEEFAGARVITYMANCSTDDWIDLLEIICTMVRLRETSPNYHLDNNWSATQEPSEALDEINYRLRQASFGYQYELGGLVRVDSLHIHSEVVKPALALLFEPGFSGPSEEFRQAHQHYREGKHREAVAMAANALESTLKAVFELKKWPYNKGSRISDLVKVGKANKLWPDYLDASFDQLLATLQSGLPRIRDNDASHGQGAVPKDVPDYIAAYALHLAASKIQFIVRASKVLK